MDNAIQNDRTCKTIPRKLTDAFGPFENYLEPALRSRLMRFHACMNELDEHLGLLLVENDKKLRKHNKLIRQLRRHLFSILDIVYYCVSNTNQETKAMLSSLLGRNQLSLAFVSGAFIETAADAYKSVYPDSSALELYLGAQTCPIDDKIAALISSRERDVLDLIMKGDPNKVIAYKLDVSESTIKAHVSSILKKLGARNRAYLASQMRALK